MTGTWSELIHGGRWQSPDVLWVEGGVEYGWEQVDRLAATIARAFEGDDAVRVVRIRAETRLGCFAGQLAAWRAGCVAVADDGILGPEELAHVRPDVVVSLGRTQQVEQVTRSDTGLPLDRLPEEVVAVNFTSGSTGSRRAVGVTRGNLLSLFGCRGLDVPTDGPPTSGGFARPAYDGWWFDTWRTAAAGGTVVCLPSVNEDVFAWPELVEKYGIDSVLLPAAALAMIIGAIPECIADIPWVFSGGEQFRVSTYQQAREVGLRNRFVNLYGPTEATFATHKYELPESLTSATIPIGKPLDGCGQSLHVLDGPESDACELVVAGPVVCLGYLENGTVARRFLDEDGRPQYRTGDLVRVDGGGDLVFAGRLDNRIKVNGLLVDAHALEHEVTSLPGVLDCRVVQDELHTVAFVRAGAEASASPDARSRIDSVVRGFSPAIAVHTVDAFPMKSGGKVDTDSLMSRHFATDEGGEQ
jgi:non-ribosomal peptide synthetase component F